MRGFVLALPLIACGAGACPAGAQVDVPPLSLAAPPPLVNCGPHPFLVFFDWDKDEISAFSRRILDNALGQYRNPECGWVRVVVSGHADRSGPDAHNVALSRRRASAVARYLVGHGVPPDMVTTRAFGETEPLIEPTDGVQELQNRRVEIFFGPGAER